MTLNARHLTRHPTFHALVQSHPELAAMRRNQRRAGAFAVARNASQICKNAHAYNVGICCPVIVQEAIVNLSSEYDVRYSSLDFRAKADRKRKTRTMTTQLHRPSAKIYAFPAHGRASRGGQRPGANPVAHPTLARSTAACCGSWYHEAAVREADQAGKR